MLKIIIISSIAIVIGVAVVGSCLSFKPSKNKNKKFNQKTREDNLKDYADIINYKKENKCNYCGAVLKDGETSCNNCGAKKTK